MLQRLGRPAGGVTVLGNAQMNVGSGATVNLGGTLDALANNTQGAYVNIANQLNYNVMVTGQVGSIANVVITDSPAIGLANVANGMDFVGANGNIVIPVDASNLVDGTVTISVTLTNGAGDSTASTYTLTKDATAPVLVVNAPPYVTALTVGSYQPLFTGETGTTVSYSVTDGTTSLSGSKFFNGSNKWQPAMNLSSFKNGPITLTVTETDTAGNPTVVVTHLIKDTAAPAGSFAVAGTTINGVVATTNPVLAITPSFTASSGISSVLYSVNGGAAQASAVLPASDGLYTVAAIVTSNVGNTATFTKQVRLDRSGPAITSSITAPTNGAAYDAGKAVTLTFGASDPDGATTAAVMDGTTSVASGVAFNTETLSAGTHAIVITSTDGLGNVSTSTVTLTIHPTISGITAAVNDLRTQGKITSSTTSSQLSSYLSSAQTALTAGNNVLAKSYLASFVAYVQGQAGTTIVVPNDALLAQVGEFHRQRLRFGVEAGREEHRESDRGVNRPHVRVMAAKGATRASCRRGRCGRPLR